MAEFTYSEDVQVAFYKEGSVRAYSSDGQVIFESGVSHTRAYALDGQVVFELGDPQLRVYALDVQILFEAVPREGRIPQPQGELLRLLNLQGARFRIKRGQM